LMSSFILYIYVQDITIKLPCQEQFGNIMS